MKIGKIVYSFSAMLVLMGTAEATSIKDVVEYTVKNNQDIVSKSLNNEAFRKYIDEQRGGYYPKLDLTAYLEKKKTDEDYKNNTLDNDETLKGGNVQVDFEQLIYDGNLTPSRVHEAKAGYISNKYKNSNDVETIIYDSISSYLNMLKFDERITASEENLKVHNEYLSIAKETEAINGEILDKVQTKAKIHNAKSRLFDEINSKNAAKSAFKRHVGLKVQDNICRPNIDSSKIPSTLSALQKMALANNYEVLEQIENIKEQRAVIAQEKASFLPTLKFKLQGIYDRDLLKQDDLKTKIYSGKIELKYNIFNGLVDRAKTQREELFLKEAQTKLDVVSKKVLDDVSVAYNTYNTSRKQIVELKEFIEDNKQIIEIYNDQFDAGTRNFIDVLNVEADLYNSKISLINTEYAMYQSYYEILKNISKLEATIVNSQNQSCSSSMNNDMDELKKLTDDSNTNAQSSVINTDEQVKLNTLVSESSKVSSNTNGNYVLFLESFSNRNSVTKKYHNLLNTIDSDIVAKIVENKNGTYTIALTDMSKEKALLMKDRLNNTFPGSYLKKKKA